jgi:predicted acetyltransferase
MRIMSTADGAARANYELRAAKPAEYRAVADAFGSSLHRMPMSDEEWAKTEPSYESGRVFAAFDGERVAGTVQSYAGRITVPGGELGLAMVSRVGVRAEHTRRGLLTRLMRLMLEASPEPIATLRASEALIYGRFGFGVATRGRDIVINRRRARITGSVPPVGSVRVIDIAEIPAVLPDVYRGFTDRRPGRTTRFEDWWSWIPGEQEKRRAPVTVVVHSDADGVDDGFVAYAVQRTEGERALAVLDLQAGSAPAWAELWRFLLSVDLIGTIRAGFRPVDEPIELLLTDYRAVETEIVEDETWLRLTDVPTALAGRTYGAAEPVVIGVRDTFLPGNEGSYRISPDGAERVTDVPDLELDVADLARLYLGDVPAGALAVTGRVTVRDPGAIGRANRLFAADEVAWAGTYF